jgi:SAM-dependent methyltransferase
MNYRELLLGCGYRRERTIDPYVSAENFRRQPAYPMRESGQWINLVTVDNNPRCEPDYLMDLRAMYWLTYTKCKPEHKDLLEVGSQIDNLRFRDNSFDEVHAYEVLEHLGALGDEYLFFGHFQEIWRILKDGGLLCATVPSRYSQWLWGDPGHKRAILPASLVFLSQEHYAEHVGQGPASDYRNIYSGNFHIVASVDNEETHKFVLQALK